jgi:hypothetical protein
LILYGGVVIILFHLFFFISICATCTESVISVVQLCNSVLRRFNTAYVGARSPL